MYLSDTYIIYTQTLHIGFTFVKMVVVFVIAFAFVFSTVISLHLNSFKKKMVYIQAHVNACNPPTSKQYHWIGYKTDNFVSNCTYSARSYT